MSMTEQKSHFALFNLEPQFAVPLDQLEASYHALATQVHPDRYAHAGEAAMTHALLLSTHANEAYRTLKKPVARARHLLSLRGIEVNDRHTAVTPEFLMAQMEWREALQDAQAAHDMNALQQLERFVTNQMRVLISRLQAQLDTEQNNQAAIETMQQLMFVEKLAHDIDDVIVQLEG